MYNFESRRLDTYKTIKENMANNYHQVYFQTVFAVKFRNAVLDPKWRKQVTSIL